VLIWVGLRVTRMRNRWVICTWNGNLLLCVLIGVYRRAYRNDLICCCSRTGIVTVYFCSRNDFLMVYFCSRIYPQPLTLLLGWVQRITEHSLFILSHTKRWVFLYCVSCIYFIHTMQKQSVA